MKKYLALLLTVVLCFGLFTMPAFSAFTDVEEGHRHSQSIAYLTEKGVINGYEDGSFKPESTITRAEFLKMLLEFLGFGNVYGDAIVKTGFSDVDAKLMEVTSKTEEGKQETSSTYTAQHWATGYIKLAVDKGVVNGYGDGTFGPDDPVKYEEAIKMMVCCLGREEHAITRAQSIGANLWPDGYLSIGNDLMISKSTEYLLGGNASRSNIAQMLYNVKDVQVYVAPNISIGGVSAGGGGGGGGVSVGGGAGEDVESNTTVVSGLIAYGQIVAAVKSAGGTNKEISIDPNAPAVNKYITLKLETPINDNTYMNFYTGGADYSHYLGYRVQLKYRFNPDGGINGRYEVETVGPKDTMAVSIGSSQFKADKTANKNLTETDVHICYTDGNEDYYQSFYTPDLDTLTVIYNNKVIDVEALRDEYIANNQPFEGNREDIDIITLTDLMPANGNIKIVDADEDTEIDVVWVESYETYVAGVLSFNTTPKSIKDKFRTTDGTTPLALVLNDADPNTQLTIVKGGEEKEVTAIRTNDLLKVAQSKCGKNVDVTVETVTLLANKKYENSVTQNGVKTGIKMNDGKTYPVTDYFRNYVDPSLEYEAGDTMTLHLNSKNEVVWATVKEVTYSTGYLIKATYSEQNEELLLDILTSSGTITKFKMAESKTKYITKANTCLDGISGTANANGTLYKNLDERKIYESLVENATAINASLPDAVKINASTAQPIMYTVATGTTLSHLITLEADSANRYTGTQRQYKKLTTGEHNFGNAFSAASGATFIFVPNSRDDKSINYKIGTPSSTNISKKLTPYAYYNIEPYYFTNAAGTTTRSVFVVYNQSIDAIPTYRSENMIISSIVPNLGSNDVVTYTINGYVASNSSTKQYKVENGAVLNAFVLDENFARTGARAEIAVGDVIRVGFGPSGTVVASIDLILDISEDKKELAPKATAVRKNGTAYDLSSEEPEDYAIQYFSRIGEVVAIDSAEIKEWCDIKISDSKTDRFNLGSGYTDKKILMYDYRGEDLPATEHKDERLKIAAMGDLWGGEILYIWQGENMEIEQIYAIRYPEVQP